MMAWTSNFMTYSSVERNKGVNIILTHGDMDGITAACIAERFLSGLDESDLDIVNMNTIIVASMAPNPETTDDMLEFALGKLNSRVEDLNEKYSIWILDRTSFTEKMLQRIAKLEYQPDLYIADHHVSSIERHNAVYSNNRILNGVEKVLLHSIDDCATSNTVKLIDNLIGRFGFSDYAVEHWKTAKLGLQKLIVAVTDWDTFRWKQVNDLHRSDRAFKIQSIDKILGTELAMNRVIDAVRKANGYIDALGVLDHTCAELTYDIFRTKYQSYKRVIDSNLEKSIMRCKYCGDDLNISIQFGMDEYQSILSDHILENEDYDIHMVIWINNSGTFSIRSKDNSPLDSCDVASNLGAYAGFSGGGHKKAAGGRIKSLEDIKYSLLRKIRTGLSKQKIKIERGLDLRDFI